MIILAIAVAAVAAIFVCGIIALHDTPERREARERSRRHHAILRYQGASALMREMERERLPTRSAKDLAEASGAPLEAIVSTEASGPAGLGGPR